MEINVSHVQFPTASGVMMKISPVLLATQDSSPILSKQPVSAVLFLTAKLVMETMFVVNVPLAINFLQLSLVNLTPVNSHAYLAIQITQVSAQPVFLLPSLLLPIVENASVATLPTASTAHQQTILSAQLVLLVSAKTPMEFALLTVSSLNAPLALIS